jgi:hypothetical protein
MTIGPQQLWQVRLWSSGDCIFIVQVHGHDVEGAVERAIKFCGRLDQQPELREFLEFDAADMRHHRKYTGEVHDGLVLPLEEV